ncbi:MAG: hypothetical protein AVDCRST_MAG54-4852 [uncultured Actinomycetospora sp.]|uniref:Uncharacterized protein n=1 Tax=uncultured Actinomycetospora sp. TaxID=1135996 RepID=A0A6J4K5H7_9PSEU|nr:MAG: hypothetical protein AVDCRST_MAG54-4852 [uncultured Actinomycetospora sp.]
MHGLEVHAGGQERADDRAGGGPDDAVGEAEVDLALVEPDEDAHLPGDPGEPTSSEDDGADGRGGSVGGHGDTLPPRRPLRTGGASEITPTAGGRAGRGTGTPGYAKISRATGTSIVAQTCASPC